MTPIKPGTARRLGLLRPSYQIYLDGRPISEKTARRFREEFMKTVRQNRTVVLGEEAR